MSTLPYLDQHFDWQTPEVVFAYDEFPLWSAAPGLMLLNQIDYSKGSTVLDIGFGTGFPLLTLARRFGPDARIIGLDVWKEAIERTRQKIQITNLPQVELIQANAEEIPLPDNSVDIITSNLGINNFAQPKAVIQGCFRVLKPGGILYLSSNLVGTFEEFYQVFIASLENLELQASRDKVIQHMGARATLQGVTHLFESAHFDLIRVEEQVSHQKYADGTAFFHDYFTIMSFLPTWKTMVPPQHLRTVFEQVELRLNQLAQANGGLLLSIPLAAFSFQKRPNLT
ncbi:MAG: class I SAM-dependent methyltransferase [Bacteroidota bacterium]